MNNVKIKSKEQCAYCAWYSPTENELKGYCHFNPPDIEGNRPSVNSSDIWCGQYIKHVDVSSPIEFVDTGN